MIIIASKEEKELLDRLRRLEPLPALADKMLELKRQIADLEIGRAVLNKVKQ